MSLFLFHALRFYGRKWIDCIRIGCANYLLDAERRGIYMERLSRTRGASERARRDMLHDLVEEYKLPLLGANGFYQMHETAFAISNDGVYTTCNVETGAVLRDDVECTVES